MDVDALNEDNPLACPKYAVQIFNYLREAEVRFQPGDGRSNSICPEVLTARFCARRPR